MSKREEIAPNGDKRYIRRDDKGRIKSSVEEGASQRPDRCRLQGSYSCSIKYVSSRDLLQANHPDSSNVNRGPRG